MSLNYDEQKADKLKFISIDRFKVTEDKIRNKIYVLDSFCNPVRDITKYVDFNYNKYNTKKRVTRHLVKYFEYLTSLNPPIHFSHADNSTIYGFRRWIKQPTEYRYSVTTVMFAEPSITEETWNSYLSDIWGFYKHYKISNKNCAVDLSNGIKYFSYNQRGVETVTYSESTKTVSPLTKAISPSDFKLILEKTTNNRDRLILELFYKSGIRRGELFNIDVGLFKKVDRTEKSFKMYIHNSYSPNPDKQTKTGGRYIKIPTTLAEKIRAYIRWERGVNPKNEHKEIFTIMRDTKWSKIGDPIEAVSISSMFKQCAKKAGFPNATLHDTRHSFVTNMYSEGVSTKDIMDQTGHTSQQTVEGYRTRKDIRSKPLEEAQGKIDECLK